MTVTFYNFSKRINSTKQPSGVGTDVVVVLKEGCSVENPILVLTGNNFTYNYAYISDFDRYYFVTDIDIQANGLVQVALSEDSLASAKTAIGATKAHILRASTGYNVDLMDSLCAVETTVQVDDHVKALAEPTFSITGCYILSIASSLGVNSENGFVTSYILNKTDVGQIANALMQCPLPDPNNIQQYVLKSLRSPLEAVISCIWVPIDYDWLTGKNIANAYVVAGDYDLGVGYKHVLTQSVFTTTDIITVHPRYSDFRAIEPYTNYRLFVPMMGTVDISAREFREPISQGGLPYHFSVDVAAGTITLSLYQGSAKMQVIQTSIAVDCPVAQTSRDMAGYVNSAINIGVGATNIANNPGAIVGMLSSGASMVMSGLSRTTNIKGSLSGREAIQMGSALVLAEITMDTADPDNANYIAINGRPLEMVDTISNHSGYILCSNASVDLQGFEGERDTINNYLNTGFYYE